MDPTSSDRDVTAGHRPSLLRRMLLTPVPFALTGARVVDLVILPVGAVVAFFVCIPILILTTIVGAAIGVALDGLGVPQGISGLFGLGGFIGGLALGFVVLLRLYRRLPAALRSWVTPTTVASDPGPTALPFRRDPDADVASLHTRIATADATLAVDEAPRADRPEA